MSRTRLPPRRRRLPTHERVCERIDLEALCEARIVQEELLTCWAEASMAATASGSVAVVERTWEVEAWGFHGCPDLDGRAVSMTGVLRWDFDVQAMYLPRTCTASGSCTNYSGIYEITAPATTVGRTHTTTATAEVPHWANSHTQTYVFP